jgi:hypothetical protein
VKRERDGPRAGEKQAGRADGLLLGWADSEKRNENSFLFLFQFSKAFSNEILKFYSSFQMEHTIQNIMQQHECSTMFLHLYLILS